MYIFIIIMILAIYIYRKNVFYKTNFLTEKSLNKFINENFKKCKMDKNTLKNQHKTINNSINYSYMYIFLRKIKIDFNLLEFEIKNRNLLYFEKFILDNKEIINNKISKINSLYFVDSFRSVKGKILIVEIAKTYVFLSLSKTNFNPVAHFRKLTHEYKFYKKEIKILPILISYFLLLSLKSNMVFAVNLKNICKRFKDLTFISKSELKSDSAIYALAKYNKHFFKYKLKYNLDEKLATFNLSKEILNVSSEIKAIILWLDVL